VGPLRKLNIGTNNITDLGAVYIAHIHTLRSLSLAGNIWVSGEAVKFILQHCVNLLELFLCGLELVSDEGMLMSVLQMNVNFTEDIAILVLISNTIRCIAANTISVFRFYWL
jgi:hypothetical protein